MRREWTLPVVVFVFLFAVPALFAQNNCVAIFAPSGMEYGDFATGIWTIENGSFFIGGQQYTANVWIQDNGGMYKGKVGHTYQGTEFAIYDFGALGTFTTSIQYSSLHQTDPEKFYMNATEVITSGTGAFANATGAFADHGTFGFNNDGTLNGWGYMWSRGSICGLKL